ncbi:Ribosomal RNA small subunit methyltransferase H [Roseibaca ekhonensis]|jgi:16S rRNA (cytosine1402-N4)-methyltransferase|uniref:Ribosomal RNA small subunit methyltransferase H n=1 Tax=Roseinatronobacter ekhonensis TaxID=254356 RepID=A0A3B0M381_9RHOB|nr:16S rRNA (cytosine(1402)-N(4))-methyltransferase RsmH [Roseibaca ekhonensis]SUZ30602.1 Ribosomal RNA small subunit methyltransferase H [Roseibaca ekhonensis]
MSDQNPHIPVLLQPILTHLAPISGVWLDGTLGAGGYARELLRAGVDQLIGVDRDPLALDMARDWGAEFGDRLRLVQGNFAQLDEHAGQPLDGVVLDLGVSSMQLDLPERGFSFGKDGPLDMRMSQSGPLARDIVNGASEETLADILFHYGEERASRRIARAILRARTDAPIERTGQLAQIVAGCLPRPKPGQSNPATRSFQGLRIAVNAEFDALIDGLEAAERALKPGGKLAVVSFHSLEDRVVKRFLAQRAGQGGGGNRFLPEAPQTTARFTLIEKKGVSADSAELAANPRARSARLRMAIRTDAAPGPSDRSALGLPRISEV